MMKILKDYGTMDGHFSVNIYELEAIGLVAVNSERSDGTHMEAWRCDKYGNAPSKDEPSFYVQGVYYEPIEDAVYDEDGEPDAYDLIGFEEV